MNFFDKIHETQITRTARQPDMAARPVPLHRRLFPVGFWTAGQRDIARAAAIEVLG